MFLHVTGSNVGLLPEGGSNTPAGCVQLLLREDEEHTMACLFLHSIFLHVMEVLLPYASIMS